MTLRLGVIGLSEGNGHPYSWSAIFNGYDPTVMEDCGFPVIPRYLEQQRWPEANISGACVNAIWTQDETLSRHIASASRIPVVCTRLEDLADYADAILLARDDAENHWEHAAAFIKLGLPVYIDKPIALSAEALRQLYSLQHYPGQIFTCSALRYSEELTLSPADREALGDILEINAITPKSWAKYAAHVIEPTLKMLSSEDRPVKWLSNGVEPGSGGASSLHVVWQSGVRTGFHATGSAASPLMLRVHGTSGWKALTFTDSFSAFRAALLDFVQGIETRTERSQKGFNERVVNLLERGFK